MSDAEEALALQFQALGIAVERECRFAPPRRFRFDFVLRDEMIAVEVEGGGWSGGRHTRGAGFKNDIEKYDIAARMGYTVYRCDPSMVTSGRAVETIKILMELNRWRLNTNSTRSVMPTASGQTERYGQDETRGGATEKTGSS